MSRSRAKVAAAVVLVSVLCAELVACAHRRSYEIYLIPEGYVGWIQIRFEVPGAKPLRKEGKSRVFVIPSTGELQVPERQVYGWISSQYYYVDARGKRRRLPETTFGGDGLIWGGETGENIDSQGAQKFERFFVGTEAEWKRHQG